MTALSPWICRPRFCEDQVCRGWDSRGQALSLAVKIGARTIPAIWRASKLNFWPAIGTGKGIRSTYFFPSCWQNSKQTNSTWRYCCACEGVHGNAIACPASYCLKPS